MVGDNYDTDILAGMRFGIDTLLVHTGVTTPEMLAKRQEKPTYVVSSSNNGKSAEIVLDKYKSMWKNKPFSRMLLFSFGYENNRTITVTIRRRLK